MQWHSRRVAVVASNQWASSSVAKATTLWGGNGAQRVHWLREMSIVSPARVLNTGTPSSWNPVRHCLFFFSMLFVFYKLCHFSFIVFLSFEKYEYIEEPAFCLTVHYQLGKVILMNQLDVTMIYWSIRSAQHVSGNNLPIIRSARLRYLQHMVSCCCGG